MRELSIFVDESGDFGEYAKHSPYYAVTIIFHDQNIDISKQLSILNEDLKNMGYENTAIHTEPLIQRYIIPEIPCKYHISQLFVALLLLHYLEDVKLKIIT